MKKQARQVFLLTTTTEQQRTTEINSDQHPSANQAPRTVTIGGVTYDVSQVPELQELVNAHRKDAAQTEKAKIYPQFEAIKKSFTEMEKATVTTAQGSASQGASGALLSPEVEQFINGKFLELNKAIQPLIESQRANSASQLELYRNTLIQANKDSVIAEMVVGTTKEELDASVIEAKRVFNTYKDQFGHRTQEQQVADYQSAQQGQAQQTNTVAQQPNQGVQTPQVPSTTTQTVATTQVPTQTLPTQVSSERTIVLPTAPGSYSTPSEAFPDIANMSQEEFANRRTELMAQMATFEQK